MSSTAQEQELLTAAQAGGEDAFRRLVEQHQGELHAHCYRMLGSVHDAEDALQEALLRAWRALPRFEGRSSLRSWLYKIATNTCLDVVGRRPKRVLPIDYAQASDPHLGPGEPIVESVWLEPYPDERLGLEDGFAAPEARYEQRESIELAFIAALQHLPPNQRAVLILREVLGYSAKEVAATLDTTVPLRSWFGGREAIRIFLAGWPLSGIWRWRHLPVRSNGQPALAFYAWDGEVESYLPFALNVLTLRDDRISDVTAFIARAADDPDRRVLARLPEQPYDPLRLAAAFERFGLPERLD